MNSGRLVVASCNVQFIQNIQKAQSRIVAEGKPQAVLPVRAKGWTGGCRSGRRRCGDRLRPQRARPAHLVAGVVVAPAAPSAVPAPAARGAIANKACSDKTAAFLLVPCIGDHPLEPGALGVAARGAVEHGSGVPDQERRHVAPDTQAAHFGDAAAHVGAGNRVAGGDDADHLPARTDRMGPPRSDRRRAVNMMAGNEGPCLREGDGAKVELPVQHRVAALPVADPAQAVAGQLLRAEPAQQVAAPHGVVADPGGHAAQQFLAAGT